MSLSPAVKLLIPSSKVKLVSIHPTKSLYAAYDEDGCLWIVDSTTDQVLSSLVLGEVLVNPYENVTDGTNEYKINEKLCHITTTAQTKSNESGAVSSNSSSVSQKGDFILNALNVKTSNILWSSIDENILTIVCEIVGSNTNSCVISLNVLTHSFVKITPSNIIIEKPGLRSLLTKSAVTSWKITCADYILPGFYIIGDDSGNLRIYSMNTGSYIQMVSIPDGVRANQIMNKVYDENNHHVFVCGGPYLYSFKVVNVLNLPKILPLNDTNLIKLSSDIDFWTFSHDNECFFRCLMRDSSISQILFSPNSNKFTLLSSQKLISSSDASERSKVITSVVFYNDFIIGASKGPHLEIAYIDALSAMQSSSTGKQTITCKIILDLRQVTSSKGVTGKVKVYEMRLLKNIRKFVLATNIGVFVATLPTELSTSTSTDLSTLAVNRKSWFEL
jgi:hypothetical protein